MRALRNVCLAFSVALFATGCFDKDKLTGSVQTLDLIARKDYTPVRFTDGIYQFTKDTKFQIPARIEVIHDNAGNHKSRLYFKKQKDKKESSCEYKSGSSQAEPKGKKELDKAKFYQLVKCDNGMKAEEVATAQLLRLRVENGGDSKASIYTQVKAVISYEATASPTPTATPHLTPTVVPTAAPTIAPTAMPTPDIFAGLPPDPGEAGKATVQGVDVDNDGVRDDVQRWISTNFPSSKPLRQALLAVAKDNRTQLQFATNKDEANKITKRILDAIVCIDLASPDDPDSSDTIAQLRTIIANTPQRQEISRQMSQHFSGSSYVMMSSSKANAYCQSL